MKLKSALFTLLFAISFNANSEESVTSHEFSFKGETGESRYGSDNIWSIKGWYGDNDDRFYLKSRGIERGDKKGTTELQGLYGKRILESSWIGQFGVRHDFETRSNNYLVFSLQGVTPFEISSLAQVFYDKDDNASLRVIQSKNFALVKDVILQPYYEANFFAQNTPKSGVDNGLTSFEAGSELRYMASKSLIPFLALRYERQTFGTANLARKNGARTDDVMVNIGLQISL